MDEVYQELGIAPPTPELVEEIMAELDMEQEQDLPVLIL